MTSFLQRLARTKFARALIGWVFAHASGLLPVRRVHWGKTLIAFRHPSPLYPIHILLVPKKALPALTDLTDADAPFLTELVETVQRLIKEQGMEQDGYRLIVNGGRFQAVPQLHFHLVSGEAFLEE